MNTEDYKARIDDLLKREFLPDGFLISNVHSFLQSTQTILAHLYGEDARQLKDLNNQTASFVKAGNPGSTMTLQKEALVAKGFLNTAREELDLGLITHLTTTVSGLVLGDFLGLAKSAFAEKTEDAKNVSAVLVAAVYEDTIRRMGSSLAAITDRRDLSKVIDALKIAKVLQGSQLTVAIGYLKFRNDALHADWDNIARETVASVIAFVEELLLKHFS